ncbi:MAG: T9SS type A sorting domain-containing protein [Ferruginibacter sp.]
MKIFTLSIAMLLLSAAAIAQTTIPCPTSFKRSNGAGGGCAIAKLTLNYSVCPPIALQIDSVYQSGVKINGSFIAGDIDCSGPKPTVIYCVSSTNIGPAGTLTIYFHDSVTYNGRICTVPDGSGGPVPIIINSFFAKRNGNGVTLNWSSSTEINAKEFIIERNTGNGFVAVGTVAATNNGGGSSYSFFDNNNSKVISQYRLKLVDLDASFKLSEIKAVKGTAAVSDFTVYPNPSVGYAKISITDISEATNVEVIDNAGRIVRSIELKTGNTVEVNNLQSGIYLVRIINKATGDAVTKKLTVTN